MRNLFKIALALIASAGLTAQAGDVTASLRGGLGLGKKDGVKDMLGFGLGTSFDLSSDNAIAAELAYFYQPGTRELVGIVPPAGVNLGASTNFQKLSASGIGLRAAFVHKLSGDWSFQAGAYLAQVKSRMDAVGDVRSTTGQIGGWASSPEKSSMGLSPYVGLVRKFGDVGNFEINLSTLRYKQVTLTPTWVGTGVNTVQPMYGAKDVTHLNLEFGVSFRL